jgi:WD40 repeat protein
VSQNRIYILILICASLISGLGGILGNIASGVLPEAWKPYLWVAWPLFGVCLLAGIGLVVWQIRLEQRREAHAPPDRSLPQPAESIRPAHREDWGEAVDVEDFYGRQSELANLERWVVADRCRTVALLGIGGIGKTALVTKLARQVKDQFDLVIWRSLRNAPPLEELLGECIQFLYDEQVLDLPKDPADCISLLIKALRARRCLLVLDNAESVLREGDRAGHYREGYEAYGDLLRRLGATQHPSCLLLTSREKPGEVALQEGETALVRSLFLAGLEPSEAREILKDKGLRGPNEVWQALIDRYSGNPLALKLVAEPIREVFGGYIAAFLDKAGPLLGDVRAVLDQQFNRLSELEQEVLYWLAIEREPVDLDALQDSIPHPVPKGEVAEALRSLRRRSLIEPVAGGFTLQNVVMEYVTGRLIDRVCAEIAGGEISLFHSHALIKAQARDYIRESQTRLILKPIADRLVAALSAEELEGRLKGILSKLREARPPTPGYAGGNALNLLVQLHGDLGSYDFSALTVWQAHLQGIELRDVNFSNADLAKTVFTETFAPVTSVAFSPDGRLLAAGTSNGEIRVWRVVDGKRLHTCEGHTNWVWSVAFSPDGRMVASGGDDATVRLWDIDSGQCLKTMRGTAHVVRSVAFSPDGRTVASGGDGQRVVLWDIATGQERILSQVYSKQVLSVAFSPDGHTLASGGHDKTIQVWDADSGQCLKTLRGHTGTVRSVAFSPDGRSLATGSSDQTIRLWDLRGEQCLRVLEGHSDRVMSVAFSPDGRTLASGSEDDTACLWDVASGQCLRTVSRCGNVVASVTFSPDGRTLAVGSYDRTVRLWDASTGRCLITLQGYTNRVRSVAFSPDGYILASGSEDRIVRMWDVSTGRCIGTLHGHTDWARSVAFSPECASPPEAAAERRGRILASCSYDRTIRLWDTHSGQCLNTLRGHVFQVRTIAFSPDGHLLVSGGDDAARLWDVASGQCLKILQGHTNRVRSVAFSPTGQMVASSGFDQTVRLWDVGTGQCLKVLEGHSHQIDAIAFSPDGTLLASVSADQSVRLWDVDAGQCTMTLQGHLHPVVSVAFSPDGRTLASGSEDRSIKLWDVGSGQCLTTLRAHTYPVESVTFNFDGSLLASSSDDGTIKLWDVTTPKTARCLKTMRPDRLYERMSITGATGLTEDQKTTLKMLGAVESPEKQRASRPTRSGPSRSKKEKSMPELKAFNQGRAVVVGVGADLPVTVDDATAVADLLRDPSRCAYPADQVRLLTGEGARRETVLSALDWLAGAAGPDATAIVYFSGHGMEVPDYYLLPYGYNLADLLGTTIPGTLFTEKLRAIRAGKLVVLLDCCHAGGQAEAKGWPGVKAPLPPTVVAELGRSHGRVVIASSRKDEVSLAGQPYSVFTAALLEAMAGYGAFEQDGYARVLDLALWVGRKVPERSQDCQHPIVKVSGLEDNFALAWYAAGEKQPRPLDWTSAVPAQTPGLDADQVAAWHRMLTNYRENLLLIEERLSEYVEFTAIPLQLVKDKRHVEAQIADLEYKLGLRS